MTRSTFLAPGHPLQYANRLSRAYGWIIECVVRRIQSISGIQTETEAPSRCAAGFANDGHSIRSIWLYHPKHSVEIPDERSSHTPVSKESRVNTTHRRYTRHTGRIFSIKKIDFNSIFHQNLIEQSGREPDIHEYKKQNNDRMYVCIANRREKKW